MIHSAQTKRSLISGRRSGSFRSAQDEEFKDVRKVSLSPGTQVDFPFVTIHGDRLALADATGR
jgi:hypothetical protein